MVTSGLLIIHTYLYQKKIRHEVSLLYVTNVGQILVFLLNMNSVVICSINTILNTVIELIH